MNVRMEWSKKARLAMLCILPVLVLPVLSHEPSWDLFRDLFRDMFLDLFWDL